MKIEALKRGVARCGLKVNSTGTGHWRGQKNRCARGAAYKVDGVNLCVNHAEKVVFKWVIQPNSNS